MRNTIDTYESFVRRALHATFRSPKLIILGVLVAAINTGSVFFHLYQFATALAPFQQSSQATWQILPAIAWIGLSNVFTKNSILSILLTISLSIILLVAGVFAQRTLIGGAHDKQPATRKSKSLFSLNSTWLHLAYINIIYFLGLSILFMIGSSLLHIFPETFAIVHSLGSITLYIMLIIVAFCWNVMILLALMHVVQEGSRANEALQSSFEHIIAHPLNVFELSLIQMVVEFICAGLFILILGIGAMLITVIITLLLASNSSLLVHGGLIFMGTLIALGLPLFAALLTSFNYHLWALYHKEKYHMSLKPVLHHVAFAITKLFART